MPIREMLTYHLDAHHKRSFVTYPYLYLLGNGNVELLNRILDEINHRNSPEDIYIIPFIGDRCNLLTYDRRYSYECNSIDELDELIQRRYDYVIEHNIYSLCNLDQVELPFIFLIFDENVDPNYLISLMRDAKRLGIFIILLSNNDRQLRYIDLYTHFSEVIMTRTVDNNLEVVGMNYKYALRI